MALDDTRQPSQVVNGLTPVDLSGYDAQIAAIQAQQALATASWQQQMDAYNKQAPVYDAYMKQTNADPVADAIKSYYTQSMGYAPSQQVLSSFEDNIKTGSATFQDLSNTLAAAGGKAFTPQPLTDIGTGTQWTPTSQSQFLATNPVTGGGLAKDPALFSSYLKILNTPTNMSPDEYKWNLNYGGVNPDHAVYGPSVKPVNPGAKPDPAAFQSQIDAQTAARNKAAGDYAAKYGNQQAIQNGYSTQAGGGYIGGIIQNGSQAPSFHNAGQPNTNAAASSPGYTPLSYSPNGGNTGGLGGLGGWNTQPNVPLQYNPNGQTQDSGSLWNGTASQPQTAQQPVNIFGAPQAGGVTPGIDPNFNSADSFGWNWSNA
jgi:hypothetical protein